MTILDRNGPHGLLEERHHERRRADHRPALAAISSREHQILAMLSTGEWTRKDIARLLGISSATVGNHMASAYKALGVDNLTAALRATGCIVTSEP